MSEAGRDNTANWQTRPTKNEWRTKEPNPNYPGVSDKQTLAEFMKQTKKARTKSDNMNDEQGVVTHAVKAHYRYVPAYVRTTRKYVHKHESDNSEESEEERPKKRVKAEKEKHVPRERHDRKAKHPAA